MLSKSVTFLDIQLSQGNLATYGRWGGNLCVAYIENYLTNQWVKEFWKSVHICQSYYQTSTGLLFLRHGVYINKHMMMYYTFLTTKYLKSTQYC